ncbi:uncharacterized protein LOC134781749 [Penaeus indicus]|uniref:uncharacterized protein LOC134781749 n=1 Tax=Penaeus indicus TaxID=29960 RepID=UPI00300CCEA1
MNNGCVAVPILSERGLRPATIMEASTADHLLIKSVDDITESWVRELLLHRCDLPDPKPPMQLKSWVKGKCPSGDPLAGFSSTRATVQVAYEVEGEGGTLRKETFVVKLIPTLGFMSELLISPLADPKPPMQLKSWVKGKCPSGDPLAGFSSTRATVQVAYEVEGEGGTLRKETFVVKLIPTLGFMSSIFRLPASVIKTFIVHGVRTQKEM